MSINEVSMMFCLSLLYRGLNVQLEFGSCTGERRRGVFCTGCKMAKRPTRKLKIKRDLRGVKWDLRKIGEGSSCPSDARLFAHK